MNLDTAAFLALIIITSGCASQREPPNILDSIPLQNLPDSLKLWEERDITQEYRLAYPSDTAAKKITAFLYSSPDNSTVAQITVFEVKEGENIDLESRERARIKNNMNALRRTEGLNSFNEDAAVIAGYKTQHFREKFYFTQDGRSVKFSTIDTRFLRDNGAVIKIGVVQRHLFYDEIMPYLINESAHLSEYRTYKNTELRISELIAKNLNRAKAKQ